ncbi:MAG: serine dehydratase, partial [Pseudobutyrivibrio sp.]|nr:serine dehydratase [Pseudobutyrivibrio sp.]
MKSIREIYKIGKGPSSSHTIGPERAATLFKNEHPDAEQFRVTLYESLSKTGKGHGTDRVLLEVLSPTPTEIIFATETPEDLPHPNTMDFEALTDGKVTATLRVLSVGGGDIRIEGQSEIEPPEVYLENVYAEVEQFCRFRGFDLAEYVEFNEGEDIWEFLAEIWAVMKNSIEEGLKTEGVLPGGLKILRKAKLLYNKKIKNELPQVRECRILAAYA